MLVVFARESDSWGFGGRYVIYMQRHVMMWGEERGELDGRSCFVPFSLLLSSSQFNTKILDLGNIVPCRTCRGRQKYLRLSTQRMQVK